MTIATVKVKLIQELYTKAKILKKNKISVKTSLFCLKGGQDSPFMHVAVSV